MTVVYDGYIVIFYCRIVNKAGDIIFLTNISDVESKYILRK